MKQPSQHTKNLESLARRLGFESYHQYLSHYRNSIGAATESEYQAILAKKRGLSGPTEYIRKLKQARSLNPKYRELATLINTRLAETGMTKSVLARKVGISCSLLCQYANGYSYPKPPRLKEILEALAVFHFNPIIQDTHHLGRGAHLQKPRHQKYAELAGFISSQLTKAGRNLEWLAERTQVPCSYIRRYASGYIYPKPETLEKIRITLIAEVHKKP